MNRPPDPAASPPPAQPVWDLFVRVFHWSLVTCVVLNSFVLEEGETAHRWIGYLASALVLARCAWGFIGSPHARFASFFPTPARVTHHLRGLLGGHVTPHEGHNPLGALMMLALMALVLGLGVTGWLQTTDAYWGDEAVQDLHEGLGKALLIAAGVHAAAALIMGRIERTRLVRAMFTGVKRRY